MKTAGRLYVVKLGGNAAASDWLESLLDACRAMRERGNRLVLVHGGGPQADELLGRLDIPLRKVNGRRITDEQTLEALKMAYAGLINTDLVSACLRHRLPALGISAVSGRLALARRRPRVRLVDRATGKPRTVDFGFVGDIRRVNRGLLLSLLAVGCVPVISCLAAGTEGQVMNVNADVLAAELAGSARASLLMYVTDVAGIRPEGKDGPIAPCLTMRQCRKLVRTGKVAAGMLVKVQGAERALERGVDRVLVVGVLRRRQEWLAALEEQTYGTVLVRR